MKTPSPAYGELAKMRRADAIFEAHSDAIAFRTDRLLMKLMIFQWLAGIVTAAVISPKAWEGLNSHRHPHVLAAFLVGGIITSLPVALARWHPGRIFTRHCVAAGQMLMSALLIHLSGGRIETHFHIFGSLAFLSFYRDWRVLVTASCVVGIEHFTRGILWPQSVYGVAFAPMWRALEHVGWMAFENVFLFISIRQSTREMHQIADRQAALELTNAGIEQTVAERTAELIGEIAERRQAEQSLQESEERFRQMAETIQDVFWMTSADGRELVYLSPGYEQVWGRTCASLYERPAAWLETILAEDRAKAYAALKQAGRGETAELEFRIERPDGAVRWICLRAYPLRDAQGKLCRVAGLAADTTERKRMEARLVEAGKQQMTGRLAGGIAHDFNTILTAIMGHADLIRQEAGPGSTVLASAAQIGKSAARAALLTQQLLAFGRRQVLRPERLNMNGVVSEMANLIRRLLGEGIELHMACEAEEPWVNADPVQIQEVLASLALNARDAMNHRGRLSIETANVTLRETYANAHAEVSPGEYVLISVSDTGGGLSEEAQAHLFEPFFTTKPAGEGTGLGLAMCYGILKQSGGHIGVKNEPGRGATFNVFLPRAVAGPPAARNSGAGEALARGTETILLVEDDAALRALAALLLRKLGYTVLEAAGGREAMAVAENGGRIEMLLADVVMPHMSGKEFADQIRNSRPEIRVLFTSAYQREAVACHGVLDADANFLHKPYTPAELARKVRATLDTASSVLA